MRSSKILILVLFAGMAVTGFWLRKDSTEEPVEKEDTGYTVEEREELMRTIGYVQQ